MSRGGITAKKGFLAKTSTVMIGKGGVLVGLREKKCQNCQNLAPDFAKS